MSKGEKERKKIEKKDKEKGETMIGLCCSGMHSN